METSTTYVRYDDGPALPNMQLIVVEAGSVSYAIMPWQIIAQMINTMHSTHILHIHSPSVMEEYHEEDENAREVLAAPFAVKRNGDAGTSHKWPVRVHSLHQTIRDLSVVCFRDALPNAQPSGCMPHAADTGAARVHVIVADLPIAL